MYQVYTYKYVHTKNASGIKRQENKSAKRPRPAAPLPPSGQKEHLTAPNPEEPHIPFSLPRYPPYLQEILFLPHPPKPPTQYAIHVLSLHLPPNRRLLPALLPTPPLPIPQHLPNRLLSPLLLPNPQPLHHPLNSLLLPPLLIRPPIPPLLQLLATRLLESALNLWIAFKRLKHVFLRCEKHTPDGGDGHLEDVHRGEDQDEGEPPC